MRTISTLCKSSLALIAGSLIAPSAFAHSNLLMESSLISGLLHPLTGIDHLLALLAVGFWAGQQHLKDNRLVPFALFSMLLAGFVLALYGLMFPAIETGIAVSVLVLGLMVSKVINLKSTLALPLIAVFSIYHGSAHGTELGSAGIAAFASGFMLSTALLFWAGKTLADQINRTIPQLNTWAGTGIALFGAMFLVA